MCRPHLREIPGHPLPEGYALRSFDPADSATWKRRWAEVETAAGEFSTPDRALERFDREFGGREEELAGRCLFLLRTGSEPAGPAGSGEEVIGTAMGWYDVAAPENPAGRIHWVGIRPAWQGRGLSKPLVSAALRVLAPRHDRAYLTTQTTSYVAVRLYLGLGFAPCIVREEERRGWSILADLLGEPSLRR